ncbi:MAG: hypothetical protein H7Y05_11180, partial [Steroidobacteraceae bacterium]|nr:hypothetical protein [Deltaproteobacteria bacterium]
MALKLGELLINEGLLTPAQLEEALKCQVIFGIKLGSSLIELGFIDENKLVRLLSKKLGVPAVTRKELTEVAKDIYSLLPSAVAEKYRVVPFKLENRRLSVAMSDPTDFKAIDELSFVTGYIIQPFIAPDINISFALEKYYQVKRDLRYIRVAGGGFNRPSQAKPEPVQQPIELLHEQMHEPIAVVYHKDDGELLNIEIPAEFEGFGSLPELPDDFYAAGEKPGRYTVDALSFDFASAGERDDIADVFIKYLGQEFSKGGLFIIRGNLAVGWRAIVNGKKVNEFEKASMELGAQSVLHGVVGESRYFMGPLAATAGNGLII